MHRHKAVIMCTNRYTTIHPHLILMWHVFQLSTLLQLLACMSRTSDCYSDGHGADSFNEITLPPDVHACMHACRYFNEMAIHALNVLRVATMDPAARAALAAAVTHSQRPGMAVLLCAAGGQAFMGDHEV